MGELTDRDKGPDGVTRVVTRLPLGPLSSLGRDGRRSGTPS